MPGHGVLMAAARIREADPDDVPPIVSIMQSEMGWPDDERAETLWRWKHETNPFGRSPVWVAELEWQWLNSFG